jgi:rubrerythrin
MHYSDYLREQAARYRQLAETAEDASVKQELLELAAVCEEVANEIDDRRSSG